MKPTHASTFALGLSLVAMAVSLFAWLTRTAPDARAPSADPVLTATLDRGNIRASYSSYPPYCIKDPNTGDLSGIFVDALEEMGRRLNLDVVWVEEVGFGTVLEGLATNRYDVHGSGLWRNASRGKAAIFTEPLFYNALYAWVRADDDRLTNLDDLRSSDVRIAVQDGAMEDLIAQVDFPAARRISIPQLNPWSDNLLNIITDKADVTFAEYGVVLPFLDKNPGTLRRLPTEGPVRVFANAFPVRTGAHDFRSMLDSAIQELISDGTMDRILTKYESSQLEHLRAAPSFQVPALSETP